MKRRKACRWYISEIRREILKWELEVAKARQQGLDNGYEAYCLIIIGRLKGEIEGIYWAMGADHNE